jgi:hypothetical protein
VTPRLLAGICLLGLVVAAGAQAAVGPPHRIVSRPFSLAHGDPVTIVVYDHPPHSRYICASVTFPDHTGAGGCSEGTQVLEMGGGIEVAGDNGRLWVFGLGRRHTTTAVVRVKGVRFAVHERGPWRAWLVPHPFEGLSPETDVSVVYR